MVSEPEMGAADAVVALAPALDEFAGGASDVA